MTRTCAAPTAPYFHHAKVATLALAVNFCATRGIAPQQGCPLLNGRPDKFNALPLGCRGKVVQTAPFGLPPQGGRVHPLPQDESDILALLRTLSEGPAQPPGTPLVGASAARLPTAPVAARR